MKDILNRLKAAITNPYLVALLFGIPINYFHWLFLYTNKPYFEVGSFFGWSTFSLAVFVAIVFTIGYRPLISTLAMPTAGFAYAGFINYSLWYSLTVNEGIPDGSASFFLLFWCAGTCTFLVAGAIALRAQALPIAYSQGQNPQPQSF